MAQKRSFLHNPHAADLFATLVDLQDRFHHVINMALRINPPGNGESYQFHRRRNLFPCFWIFTCEHDGSDLHTPNSGFEIEFGHQRLSRVLQRGDMGQHGLRIDIDGMPSGRLRRWPFFISLYNPDAKLGACLCTIAAKNTFILLNDSVTFLPLGGVRLRAVHRKCLLGTGFHTGTATLA